MLPSVSACAGSRARSTGSNRSQRSQTASIRSPVSMSNGSSTVPSGLAEYAAAIAYVLTSTSSCGDESTGRPERKSAQKASKEPLYASRSARAAGAKSSA